MPSGPDRYYDTSAIALPAAGFFRQPWSQHSHWTGAGHAGHEREQAVPNYGARDSSVPYGDVQFLESPEFCDSECAHGFYEHGTCGQRGPYHVDVDVSSATAAWDEAGVLDSAVE